MMLPLNSLTHRAGVTCLVQVYITDPSRITKAQRLRPHTDQGWVRLWGTQSLNLTCVTHTPTCD
jgi:hypothetical protein